MSFIKFVIFIASRVHRTTPCHCIPTSAACYLISYKSTNNINTNRKWKAHTIVCIWAVNCNCEEKEKTPFKKPTYFCPTFYPCYPMTYKFNHWYTYIYISWVKPKFWFEFCQLFVKQCYLSDELFLTNVVLIGKWLLFQKIEII